MGFNVLAYPQFLFIGTTTPTDTTAGKLWYNTAENVLYSSDGTNYNKIADIGGQLYGSISENTLKILELEAAATISGGQSAYMMRDIYTDSGGYLNTIDTGTTDALFSTDKYTYVYAKETATTEAKTATTYTGSGAGPYTANIKAKSDLIISQVTIDSNNTNADVFYCNIIQNGDTIATKTATANSGGTTFSFTTSDYTRPILDNQDFSVVWGRQSGTSQTNYLNAQSIDGTLLYMNNTQIPGEDGSGTMGIWAKAVSLSTTRTAITNAETIDAGATRFIIYTFDEATTGDGNITYDVSFNNGTNYQTGINAGVETGITNTGTSLIVKQNFNSAGGEGTATSRGYAIIYW